MAGNPRIVTEDVTFTWDGAPQRLPRGQVIDVPAGSALEAAIGPERLIPLRGTAAAAPAAAPAEGPQEDSQPAARKSRSAKTQDAGTGTPDGSGGKDGDA